MVLNEMVYAMALRRYHSIYERCCSMLPLSAYFIMKYPIIDSTTRASPESVYLLVSPHQPLNLREVRPKHLTPFM